MENHGKFEITKNEKKDMYLKKEKSDSTWISNAHYHDSIEFCFYLKGKVVCHVNGTAYSMKAGEIIAIENLKVHYFELDEGSEYIALRIGKEYMKTFDSIYKSEEHRVRFPEQLDKISENKEIFQLLNRFCEQFEECNKLQLHGFITLILGTIQKHYGLVKYEVGEKELEREMLSYLHENVNEEITIKEMAKHFGYSEKSFSRKLHGLIGQDVRSYVNGLRMKKFFELRKSVPSMTITEAALNSGFKSMNTFYRAHAKYMDCYQLSDNDNFYM